MARAPRFAELGIGFVDAGVSGGVRGLESGYSLMLGGAQKDIDALWRVLEALAPRPGQWLRCGPTSAWHTIVAGRFVVRSGALVHPGVPQALRLHTRHAIRIQGS